ncbi:VOC family protein [Rhodococcus koreensis]
MLDDYYMININVADLERSIAFYNSLGFEVILDMDVTDPTVGDTYGVDEFRLIKAVWMRLATAHNHRWPVLDLVQFVDPPVLQDGSDDAMDFRRRRGLSRISFRAGSIDEVVAMHDRLLADGTQFLVPLTRRADPTGRPLALFWLRDPDGTVVEVLHVAAR